MNSDVAAIYMTLMAHHKEQKRQQHHPQKMQQQQQQEDASGEKEVEAPLPSINFVDCSSAHLS